MTDDKDFKRIVRTHAAKIGKSYTAALRDFRRDEIDPTLEPSVRTVDPVYLRGLLRLNTDFLRPVRGLDIYDVRYSNDSSGHRNGIYLLVQADTQKERIAEIARKAKAAWERPGVVISILQKDSPSGGHEVWSTDMTKRHPYMSASLLASIWQVPPEVVAGLV